MITGNEPAYPSPRYATGLTIRQAYKMTAIQSGMFTEWCDRYMEKIGIEDALPTMEGWAGRVADAMIEEDNKHE
jgi:hypothetical protein